jgi:hypothetical protein
VAVTKRWFKDPTLDRALQRAIPLRIFSFQDKNPTYISLVRHHDIKDQTLAQPIG